MTDELARERNRQAVRRYREKNRNRLNKAERQRRATDLDYRDKRKAQVRRSVSDWKALNPEKAKAIAKRHYDANVERMRASARARYWADPESRKAESKARYHADRDRHLAAAKRRGLARKVQCFTAYGGCVCACCGDQTLAFLTIDHIDGCGQARRKTEGYGNTNYQRLIREGFPHGYRVLCFNCNCGRRVNGGLCPHKMSELSATG